MHDFEKTYRRFLAIPKPGFYAQLGWSRLKLICDID
jgi:hypothetical protein